MAFTVGGNRRRDRRHRGSRRTANGVDTVGQVGRFSSITVGADGLPLISYNDLGNGNLKVLACGNLTCSPHVKIGR